jgi:hypothetical protein
MSLKSCSAILLGVVVLAVVAGCPEREKELAPGEQYVYTCKEGDDSFADVADKVYGDAKHASLIEKANLAVEADELKPGAKLVVPPLTTEEGETIAPKGCDRQKIY